MSIPFSFSSLSNEVRQLKETLLSQMRILESDLEQVGTVAAEEAQRAEQIRKSLKAEVATLQAQVGEKEEAARAKEAAVGDLENQVKEKEGLLEVRDAELKDLKSKTDLLGERISRIEYVVKQAESAAGEVEHAKQVSEGLRAEVAALQAQLREKEEAVRAKESTVHGLEEGLSAQLKDLENQVKEKEGLLGVRDAELKGLKTEMDGFGEQMARMEAVTKQAESAAASEARRAEQMKESLRAEIASVQAQPGEKEEFHARETGLREAEESLAAKLKELENQVKEQEGLLEARDTELKGKDSLVQVKEEEIKKIQEEMSAEITKLRSELQTNKVGLASRERDAWRSNRRWKMWKQGMGG